MFAVRHGLLATRVVSPLVLTCGRRSYTIDDAEWKKIVDSTPFAELVKTLLTDVEKLIDKDTILQGEPRPDPNNKEWEADGTNAFLAASDEQVLAMLHANKLPSVIPSEFIDNTFALPTEPIPEFDMVGYATQTIAEYEPKLQALRVDLIQHPEKYGRYDKLDNYPFKFTPAVVRAREEAIVEALEKINPK